MNEWWETAYAEIDSRPLSKALNIKDSFKQFYAVTDFESGKKEIFSGKS